MSKGETLFCSECGMQIKPEQLAALKRGEMIYCEQCGKSFQVRYVEDNSATKPGSAKVLDLKKIGLDLTANIMKTGDQAKDWVKSRLGLKKETPAPSPTPSIPSNQAQSKSTPAPKPAPTKPASSTPASPSPQKTSPTPPPTQRVEQPMPFMNNKNPKTINVEPQESTVVNQQAVKSKTNRPAREIPKENIALRKFNDFSAVFALLMVTIVSLFKFFIDLLPRLMPINFVVSQQFFIDYLLDPVVKVCLALIIIVYDIAYARKKILHMELESYGLDMIIAGVVGSILAWGSGIFLALKGFLAMGLALADKERNPSLYGSFWDAVFKSFNIVGGIYGLVTLFGNISVFLSPTSVDAITVVFAYMALICILIDMCALVPLVFMMKNHVSYPIAFALIICGILASFFQMAGIIIIAQGIILLLISVFSPE